MSWSEPIGSVLIENSEAVPVGVETTYPLSGVMSYARGLFVRGELSGDETAYKTLHRVRSQQIVLSTLKGWEGAIALAGPDHDGRFLPPHNVLFDVDTSRADPAYLFWSLKRPSVWAALRNASRGMGARRETVKPADFCALTIPLPPLTEQRRIVARLNAAAMAIERVQSLRTSIDQDLSAFITRANETYQAQPVRLADALILDEDRVTVTPDAIYPQVGIRGFGGGLFRKGGVTAADTTYRHFNRLTAGQFVVSQVKGWEGAVAVCDDEHAGLFASPEYRTFRCNPTVLSPAYFAYLCRTPWFHAKLAPATRGQGARRERLRPEMLMVISIPLPPVDIQGRLVPLFDRVAVAAAGSGATDLDHLLPAMLNEAFDTDAGACTTGAAQPTASPSGDA